MATERATNKTSCGFGLLGIIIALAVVAGIVGGGLYVRELKNQKSLSERGSDAVKQAEELKAKIERQNETAADELADSKSTSGVKQTMQTQVRTATSTGNIDTSNWKIYRNEKYGFEFKYPNDLTVEVVMPDVPVDIAKFRIYDSNYVAPPDAVGQQVRNEFREITFGISNFSSARIRTLQDEINETLAENSRKGLQNYEKNIATPVGVVRVFHINSGLIGLYLTAYFHNTRYIFSMYALEAHSNLAEEILINFHY